MSSGSCTESSNPVRSAPQSAVQRNLPGILCKLREMGAISRFLMFRAKLMPASLIMKTPVAGSWIDNRTRDSASRWGRRFSLVDDEVHKLPRNASIVLVQPLHRVSPKIPCSQKPRTCRMLSQFECPSFSSGRYYGSVGAESPVIRSFTLLDSSASSITKNKPPRPFRLLLQFPEIAPC
jgi:hypothetical protein